MRLSGANSGRLGDLKTDVLLTRIQVGIAVALFTGATPNSGDSINILAVESARITSTICRLLSCEVMSTSLPWGTPHCAVSSTKANSLMCDRRFRHIVIQRSSRHHYVLLRYPFLCLQEAYCELCKALFFFSPTENCSHPE